MNIETQAVLVEAGGVFVTLVFPPVFAWSIRRRRKAEAKHWTMPVLVAVAASWLLQIVYRIRVELPVNIRRAEERGNLEYDGVGGNVAALMAGWLLPLLVCLIVVAISKIYSKPQKPGAAG